MSEVIAVIGERPLFVKVVVVNRALASRVRVEEIIVHTGQHYNPQMSRVFFDEMRIPTPLHNLAVASGPHGFQTAPTLSDSRLRVARSAAT